MKSLTLSIVIASVVIGSTALAKGLPVPSGDSGKAQLRQALGAIAATADAQGPNAPDHFNPKTDGDQGDDRANPGAILKVCGKATPAAHRAAICPTGVSPN